MTQKHRPCIIIFSAFVISLLHLRAVAQNEPPVDKQDLLKAARVDYLVPDSPALSLSGLSIDKTARPQTPKALETSLRSAFDDTGKLKNALSVAGVPYLMLKGEGATLERYSSDYLTRALANVELSFAGAKGESTNDVNRYALGLRWNILDSGDPRIVNVACVREAVRPLFNLLTPENFQEMEEKIRNEGRKAVSPCYEAWQKKYWNAFAIDLGAAYGWAEGTSSLTGVHKSSTGIYGSLSLPVGEHAQAIIHARYVFDELVPDKSNKFFNQDQGFFGGRLRIKLYDRLAFNAEGGYLITRPYTLPNDHYPYSDTYW